MSDAKSDSAVVELTSGVPVNPGDKPLSEAIARTLDAPAAERATLFEALVKEIEATLAVTAPEKNWTCAVYTGTDGSRIFRGGVGHSLVVDPEGRLWRARSYEDFETSYTITPNSCEIATLTPLYAQMREYTRR